MKKDKEVTIQELKDKLIAFKDERGWGQFHDPKNLAEAISIEAAELQELFLWQDIKSIDKRVKEDHEFKKRIEEELADVIIFGLNLVNALNIDLSSCIESKIKKNEEKYLTEKAKRIAKKHTDL